MPACTVTRTHDRGRKLHRKEWQELVCTVSIDRWFHPELNRDVPALKAERRRRNGGWATAMPLLCDPRLIAMRTTHGMSFVGFEEIDGQRYYQGWYIRWITEDERRVMEGEVDQTSTTPRIMS